MSMRLNTLCAALAATTAQLAASAPATNSAYRVDTQHTYVEDETSKGIKQVNMITCIMTAMRPDALVNKGAYLALVDENKCNDDARSSSSNSASDSAGSSAASYTTATIDSARASNTDPMRMRAWLDESNDGQSATIYVNTVATEAPSDSNPYGVFRLDYCGQAGSDCMMQGYLEGSSTGVSYFEIESRDGGSQTKALRLSTSGTDSGSGMLQMDEMGQQVSFGFAYDSQYFRRASGSNDQCFSRDADDPDTGMSVWRYGLYDADTGERVVRHSAFPVEYGSAAGKTFSGQMGYWGLWLPPEIADEVVNGSTLQKLEFVTGQEPTRTPYTVVKADGRLMKYSKQVRTLASTDKLRFNTWIWDANGFFDGAQANRQYELYWDDAAGSFKASGMIDCGGNGCQSSALDSDKTVSVAYFANHGGVHGWSQTLGGELSISLTGGVEHVDSSAVNVIFRSSDLVYPADMPSSLSCLRDCPTAATIADYFTSGSSVSSPFVAATFSQWQPTAAADVVSYSGDAARAVLADATGVALTFTDRAALQAHPQYQNGLRTGRLFTDLSAVQCDHDASHYCDNKVGELDIYYQWETGPNQWNQFAAVKDASGNVVTFDAPLQVNYSVPDDARYGSFAGKSIVLQYGGYGDLWGIPGHCVNPVTNEPTTCDGQGSRYVPAFMIPFDETLGRVSMGSTTLLVKWLEREIRFARKDVSVCTSAGLSLPSGLSLPTASGLNNPADPASAIYIGAKPVVSAAPRVIHGEVMY